MRTNVGFHDRVIRFTVALIMIAAAYNNIFEKYYYLSFLFYFLGIVLMVTTLFAYDPLYSFFNHSTKMNKLGRITKRDIERAVKEYNLDANNFKLEQIRVERTFDNYKLKEEERHKKTIQKKSLTKNNAKTPALKKASTQKKVIKKVEPKKSTPKKKLVKKVVKKPTPKKATVSKAVSKKSVVKKQVKKAVPKKSTKKK